jgi:NAD(P)-dependent dehydrogenase (short-subunit alcohol dehydrogenase family)
VGRGIALELAAAGADVAVNYHEQREAAQDVVVSIQALGRRAGAFQADVTQVEQCEALVQAATRELGPIDILVNNAGIAPSWNLVAETDAAEVGQLFASHVLSSFHLCKLLLPSMRQRERADIVMISSVQAQVLGPRWVSYSIAKAGLEALAFTLAKEERINGIHVNIVAPTWVESDMMTAGTQALYALPPGVRMDSRLPFGFTAQPADVGKAVAFLCSEGGRYITNARLNVTGGAEAEANFLRPRQGRDADLRSSS